MSVFKSVLRDNPNSSVVSSNRFVKACSDPEIASARVVEVSLAPLIAVALIKSVLKHADLRAFQGPQVLHSLL